MNKCKKCSNYFEPTKGLINYCSVRCRNSRIQTEEVRKKKSISAKINAKNPIKGKFGKDNPNWVNRISTKCLHCNQPIYHLPSKIRKYHLECWKNCSGGLREGSTIRHRAEYKNQIMDSGAEKAFAIRCDELKIKWIKNKDIFFKYLDTNNKERKYYPDFFLPEYNIWVEIKGKFYEDKDPNFEYKMKSINNILLIYSTEIKKFNGLLV